MNLKVLLEKLERLKELQSLEWKRLTDSELRELLDLENIVLAEVDENDE